MTNLKYASAGLVALGTLALGSDPASAEFFETNIRPILHEHCLPCHGGDAKKEPKGGFRLHPRPILIRIGEPIPTEGLTPQDRERLRDRVRAAILDLKARVDAEAPAR